MRTYKKSKAIKIRCSEILFRKLSAICAVTGKTKTAILEELIMTEYDRNKKYSDQYYMDLDKEI